MDFYAQKQNSGGLLQIVCKSLYKDTWIWHGRHFKTSQFFGDEQPFHICTRGTAEQV